MKRFMVCFFSIAMIFSFCACGGTQTKVSLSLEDDDTQPGWNIYNQLVAKGPEGYYYITERGERWDRYIYYMDAKTKQITALCNKAECNHRGSGCNAYLDKKKYNTLNVYYYKDNLYIVQNDESNGLSKLVRISPDGSERETLFEIGELSVAYKLTFCDDAVYIYRRVGGHGVDTSTETVRRRSLDGKDDKVIYSVTLEDVQISAVKAYGGKAFILVTQWSVIEETKTMSAKGHGVYMYDPETDKTKVFLRDNISDFTVDTKNNNIYYYVINEGLYKRSLSGGDEEKIYSCEEGSNNVAQISCDGNYIYMSNELYIVMEAHKSTPYMWIMNTDGTEAHRIKTLGAYTAYFGEGDLMFCGYAGENGMRYIEKSDILTATEWKNVELGDN